MTQILRKNDLGLKAWIFKGNQHITYLPVITTEKQSRRVFLNIKNNNSHMYKPIKQPAHVTSTTMEILQYSKRRF